MPGPFDTYDMPWEPVPAGPSLGLDDIEQPVFDPSLFPTVDSIEAQIEAEQAAPARPPLELSTELQAPTWAAAQMSPEAEAELTGKPVLVPEQAPEPDPSPEYTADLAQRMGGFNGQAPQAAHTLGADIGLDPMGVISPESTPLTDEEIEGIPGAESVQAQDLSDEALAMRQLEIEQEQEAFRREREREELAETTERKLRDAEVYEASMAKANERTERILQRSQELGTQQVDNDRWVNSQSTASKIGMALAAIGSGYLGVASGRGGNDAIALFQGLINQDIETQKFNIQKGIQDLNRDKGLVATLYEQTGDLYEATETARLASYEAGIAKIDGELAKMDPEGTQAVSMEIQKRQLRGRIDAQKAAVAAAQRKAGMDDAKFQLEAMDKDSAVRKREAEIRKLDAEAAKAARRGSGKKQEDIYTQDYWEGLYGKDARPPIPMSKREHSEWLTTRGKVASLNPGADPKEAADTIKAEGEAEKIRRENAADSKAVRDLNGGKPLIQPDGSVWRHDKASEAADIMEVTQNITRATDEIARLRAKTGGNWDSLKSADWQKIRALTRQIDFENAVALKLGALSEGDLAELVAFRGGADPNSQLFDALPGLEQMGRSVVDKANTRMRRYGWQGDRWEPSRKTGAVSREKSLGGVARDITNTTSFDFKTPAEVFKDRQSQIDVFLEKDPSIEEIRELANNLGNLKAHEGARGVEGKKMLSQDQIYKLAGQMRKRYEKLQRGKGLNVRPLQADFEPGALESDEDFFNALVRGE